MDVKLELRCRVCLEYFPIALAHTLSNSETLQMFQKCTNLMVLPEDDFPQQLCPECYERCLSSFEFRSQAIESDSKLCLLAQDRLNCSVGMTDWNSGAQVKLENEENDVVEELVEEIATYSWGELISVKEEDPLLSINCGSPSQAETTDAASSENTRGGETSDATCNVCGKSFVNSNYLRQHRRLHTGERPYSCEECGDTFTFRSSLIKHCMNHIGYRPYQCAVCKKSFENLVSLKDHRKCRTECNIDEPAIRQKSSWSCGECDETILDRSDFVLHIMAHRKKLFSEKVPDEGINNAPYRGESPAEGTNASSGSKKISKDATVARLSRSNNGRNIKSVALNRAKTQPKLANSGSHNCKWCGQWFAKISSLRIHERYHTGKNLYTCVECAATFVFNSQLLRHCMKHIRFRPFQCEVCTKSYGELSFLKTHLKTSKTCHVSPSKLAYLKNKSWSCDECPAIYSNSSHLVLHIMSHRKEKRNSKNASSAGME